MRIATSDECNKLDLALGLQIRQRRKALGMSQQDLAEATEVTFQQIQKYERGANRISFSRLVLIARALKCRVIDLIGDIDDSSIPAALLGLNSEYLRAPAASELLASYFEMPLRMQRIVRKLIDEILAEQRKVELKPED